MWKNLCKRMRESMCVKCEENCGKEMRNLKNVDNLGFKHCFTKSFHNVFNKYRTPYKCGVFHIFHIAYNYNY